MYILFPGRHLLMTNFQFRYLYRLINGDLKTEFDVNKKPLNVAQKIDGIIFAVTSSNHSNTRRNPVPFYQRVIGITGFAERLNIPFFIYGIDDVGNLPDFVEYVIKRISHLSEGNLNINPENALILCSTSVLKMYEDRGFTVLPCELQDKQSQTFSSPLPWKIVEEIAKNQGNWKKNHFVLDNMHPAFYKVWSDYNIGEKVVKLFHDNIIGNDGDITETRDYNSYVRQMDEIAEIKYRETEPFILPGRIGDIGCAAGSWIKMVSSNEKFRESDFYGIEVTRILYDICEQRKENGEFKNPFVFFSQKNAVSGLVFEKDSMNTIHTSSLTHEIFSYGSQNDLFSFIKNRFEELTPGGIWINRDVVGPENGEKEVYMLLNQNDGENQFGGIDNLSNEDLKKHLDKCSTFTKFLIFSKDFRKKENFHLEYDMEQFGGKQYIKLTLKNACEFMYKKDYTDNWRSEMHELFCFWNFKDWCENNEKAGFRIHENSKTFKNNWIIKKRFYDKVQLFEMKNNDLVELDFPETHMILISEKI
jgi:hypothetical protein